MTVPRIAVGVAGLEVATAPTSLAAVGLGSCVAVMIYDPVAKVGGMAHVLLPSPASSRRFESPGRFAQTAVPALLEQLEPLGADLRRLTARLVGGASMFANLTPPGSIQMGERNVVAVREALHVHGIRVIGEQVGGDYGRSVEFNLQTGVVTVTSVSQGVAHL